MKKLSFILMSVLLCLAGCTSEEVAEVLVTKGKIQATFENQASRLAIGEGNALTWSEGDAFKMFDETGEGSVWTLEGTGGSETGVFGGTELESTLKGAAFPASAATSVADGVLTMTLPATLDFEAGVCNLPMWASFTSLDVAISFKHLGALLKIDFADIPAGYNQLTVTADKPLAGVFTADLAKAEPTLVAAEQGAVNSVTVNFTASASEEDKLFFLPLPVGTYGSIQVAISDGETPLQIADWKDRTIERKKVYLASLTYKTSSAVTTAEVDADLGDLKAVTLEITEKVEDVEAPVTLPEGAIKVGLNFAEVPVTTAETPLTVTETSAAEGAELSISIPESEDEESYLTLDVPNTTATVESGNYKKIIAHTAANTLILGPDVKVEEVVILGGNVVLNGAQVGSIVRDAENADAVTFVYAKGTSTLEGVNLGEGVVEPDYLTLTADAAQTLSLFQTVDNVETPKAVEGLEYSVGGGVWAELGTSTVTFGGTHGTLRLRAINPNGTALSETDYANVKFGDSAVSVSATGDLRTLVDYERYTSDALDTSNARFVSLFRNCTALVSAPKLPATVLASSAYCHLFNRTSLTEAPELPATVLADRCYSNLFFGTLLTKAPELPATNLVSNCYVGMFGNCVNLTEAPELPAITLAPNCYGDMFFGCTALTEAPELPATTLTYGCYQRMFWNSGLTEAPELPATTLANNCYTGMFWNCKGLTTAPELPATTLAMSCYSTMFSGCTALTEAPELPATTLIYGCYTGMFQNCTALTEAPALPATTLAGSCYQNMFSGCTSLAEAPALPATTLAMSCYAGMFQKTALTEAPELPATTLAMSCYSLMFDGCTGLTKAPVLPAEKLENSCYNMMFIDCSNLVEVTMLATDVSANRCMNIWLNGTASTGTFYKNSALTDVSALGVPEGWTVEGYKYEIRYTSTDGNVVTPKASDVFGASIVSNTYVDGVGIIEFDGPVTAIGSNAFSECATLETIIIPNTVTYIGSNAFYYCQGLTGIEIPNSVTDIGSWAFHNCTVLESVTLPKYITDIKENTFNHCDALKSIVIPDGVTTIGWGAFRTNLALTSVTLPKELVTIADQAFQWCDALPSITIPEKVTSVGAGAFVVSGTGTVLATVYCKAATPPALGNNLVFSSAVNPITIHVPAASLAAYQDKWGSMSNCTLVASTEF